MNNVDNKNAKEIRLNILRLANKSKTVGAHIGPSLSIAEILSVLFCNVMNHKEDIFVLSKGHAGLAYYCAMKQAGLISQDMLDTFEVNGGDFPGQPSRTINNGVCFSSGSLGLGLSYATGLAYIHKKENKKGKVYVLLGNGELDEGTNWEALMFIRYHNLDNIVIIIDDNGMQSDGNTNTILNFNIEKAVKGFGYDVLVCNGHDNKAIYEALMNKSIQLIIAKTIKGKGVSFMENNNEWHHAKLDDEKYYLAYEEVINNE